MNAYEGRSDTDLDATSVITPVSFLGRGRPRTMAARLRLSSLSFFDTLFPSEVSADPSYQTAPSGTFDWNNLIESAGDAYASYQQAKLTEDLYQLNLTRAQQGLSPIAASAVAPQVNVGVSADTQRTALMLGLGAAAILGGAYAFGVIGKGRRNGARRRRR